MAKAKKKDSDQRQTAAENVSAPETPASQETPTSTVNPPVSIHVPGAPKKKPSATNSSIALKDKSSRKVKQDEPIVSADIEYDKDSNDEDSLFTESSPSEEGEDDDDEDDEDEDDHVSVNDVKGKGRQIQSAADKRFANEQPVWSDQTSTKESARHVKRAPPVGNSDKEFKNQANSQGRKNLIIRGHVIEVSDDEDKTDIDDSPSARLVPPLSQPESLPATANPNDLGSSIWPVYTRLIKGTNKDLTLTVQCFELRLIVRKAMELVEELVRFEDAFPDFIMRTAWNRTSLIEACSVFQATSHIAQVRYKYEVFKERMRLDIEYVAELSRLLDPRVSILRGDTKILAINNARVSYGLQEGCGRQVNLLLTGSHYIYPLAPNGVSFQLTKPFENQAIIGTLHDDLFSGNNTIVSKYPLRFRPTDQELDSNKLAPSMIALAATAVYASLKEWENGHRIHVHFTANIFEMIYRGHLEHLEDIHDRNIHAYNALVRRLFLKASGSEHTAADKENLTDVQNMSTEV
ncbi:hypothetical protein M378DRAFT_182265 [Amanita muscaria Koide BX008]|uniref:DUF6532 domain-containing protein n=1 Tax=Amanita muscaria (strain Koide BX008) TaxID=946122 RepID=A0A0C2SMT4_AMAMK|nr:hypothetical protein M378DRAFT_182265 [Amanita muscaria Koide BX008]